MTKGVNAAEFANKYGISLDAVYGPVIQRNVRDGLLEYRKILQVSGKGQEKFLALTDKGLDVSNYVMAEFLI